MQEEKKQQIAAKIHSVSLRPIIYRTLQQYEFSNNDENISSCMKRISTFEEMLNSSPTVLEITVWSNFLTTAIVLDKLGWEFNEDFELSKRIREFYEAGSNLLVFSKGSKIAVLGSMKTNPYFETLHNTALSLFNSCELL